MSKKLMLLAAGALTVLAFSALPSAASAGTFKVTCSNGGTCNGTVSSSTNAVLEAANGLRVTCTKTGGSATAANGATSGTTKLEFSGCSESIFGTSCNSSGAAAGTIITPVMTADNVIIDASPKVVGTLVTGVNVTFLCFGGTVKHQVTGNVLGEIENPNCGVAGQTSTTFNFVAGATTGTQKWTQVTTTGTSYHLETSNDNGEPYEASSQTGTGKITWTNGTVTNDC